MTNFIPIFPLSIVVYPGENLNLHIFEPRYKQLIQECHTEKKSFGIPPIFENRLQEFGTLIAIKEISKVHDNGEMDIKTIGTEVFRILEVIKSVPDKLYSGAIVNYPENKEKGSPEILRKVVTGIRELHKILKISKEFGKNEKEMKSYDLAHLAGLSQEEEYELLCLMEERQRLEYLKRHLTKVIPLMGEMEHLKEKIKLNGHFKNLSGFELES